MRSRFAPIVELVRELFYGPEPVGTAMARVQGYYRAQQLGPGNGTPHFNARGDPAVSFTGLAASPQLFRGAAKIGLGAIDAATAPVFPKTALPSSRPPEALPAWLNQLQALQEQFGP